jgi:hypothetical protein
MQEMRMQVRYIRRQLGSEHERLAETANSVRG